MTTREMVDLIRQGTRPLSRKILLQIAKRLQQLEAALVEASGSEIRDKRAK